MNKYTLYIGLNDKDTKQQHLDNLEASKIVQNILTEKTGGGTMYNATGVYKHHDGTVIIENTLRVEIVAAALEAVREAYEEEWDDSEFYLVREELEAALPQFDVDCIPISFCADVLILSPND